MADQTKPDGQDDFEFDPLDPHSATRVAPRGLMPGDAAPAVQAPAAPVVDRQAATKVVSTPAARPAPPPLKIDFAEVLGKSREAAGAHRIGAHALEMNDFQSRYDKEALERAQTTPKFDMPSSLEDDERFQPLRVVERRGRVWLRALLFVLIPAVLAVGGAFVYLSVRTSGTPDQLERLKKADEIHRQTALEHEKEMAR